jgi:hypothetical protein
VPCYFLNPHLFLRYRIIWFISQKNSEQFCFRKKNWELGPIKFWRHKISSAGRFYMQFERWFRKLILVTFLKSNKDENYIKNVEMRENQCIDFINNLCPLIILKSSLIPGNSDSPGELGTQGTLKPWCCCKNARFFLKYSVLFYE